jgi:GNAT superfamily N-acetyltransferase
MAELFIRKFAAGDARTIVAAFSAIGWSSKSASLFDRYLREQEDGRRDIFLAFVGADFAGYVTVNWHPSYQPLAVEGIPEIQDLNVLPKFRRRGIATRLVDQAEEVAGSRCKSVGIGVGLHPGYNAAQRMYVRRGYIPDGNGVTVRDEFVQEGQTVVMDDDVVLHLLKALQSRARAG